jgi:signal transduction histidine kinase
MVAAGDGFDVHVQDPHGLHMCAPASTRAEQLAAAAAWAREGLARGDYCLYVAEDPRDPQLRAALDPSGTTSPDVLAIVGVSDAYLLHGPFESQRMLDWWRTQIQMALQRGFTSVRACGEFIGIGSTAHEAISGYEVSLNDMVRDHPIHITCIYDRGRFPARIVRDAFNTHPYIWVNEVVCHNPLYVPTEYYLAADRPVGEVTGIIDQVYRDELVRRRRHAWSRATLADFEHVRREIARALHDELGQAFVALALAGRDDAVDAIDDAIETIRVMSRRLRPSALDDLGLIAAVRALASRSALRADLKVTLELTADDSKLAPEVVTTCFRIIESALSNVVSHAHATTFAVGLRDEPGAIALYVRDDGRGFTPATTSGPGLVDMQERANLAGGRLEIESTENAGTTIRAWIPV